MLEDVYETIRGILFDELPKNAQDLPAIYDQAIKKWYVGEATLTGTDTPAILIKGETVQNTDEAYGTRQQEYKIEIEAYVQGSTREASERLAQEASRLLSALINKHRRLWVVGICPICLKSTLSPEHFVTAHNDILAPYVTAAQTSFNTTWGLTHTSSSPTLASSALSAVAFLNMYDSVIDMTNPTITNLSSDARSRILTYKDKLRKPVRLLYNVATTDVKTSDGGEGQQLLYKATLSLSATELLRVTEYGPDNVSVDSWERHK